MNKRTMVYAITLVWVAVLLQCVVTLGLKNDGKITEAFLSGESSPLTGTLTVKGELSNYLYSVTEKKELLSYLASSLNMTEYQEVIEEEAEEPVEIKKLAIPRYSPAQLAAKAKKEGDAPDIVKDEITKVTLFDYSDIFADEEDDDEDYYDDED